MNAFCDEEDEPQALHQEDDIVWMLACSSFIEVNGYIRFFSSILENRMSGENPMNLLHFLYNTSRRNTVFDRISA